MQIAESPAGLVKTFAAESFSEAGRGVERTVRDALTPENTTAAVRRADIYGRLVAAARNAYSDGRRFSTEALGSACDLLEAIPATVPIPEVSMDCEDIVDLDWCDSPRACVSLHVGSRGIVGYSALLGSEASYGKVAFSGELPQIIKHLLSRIPSAHSRIRARARRR